MEQISWDERRKAYQARRSTLDALRERLPSMRLFDSGRTSPTMMRSRLLRRSASRILYFNPVSPVFTVDRCAQRGGAPYARNDRFLHSRRGSGVQLPDGLNSR